MGEEAWSRWPVLVLVALLSEPRMRFLNERGRILWVQASLKASVRLALAKILGVSLAALEA
jgi:hypothetical protein